MCDTRQRSRVIWRRHLSFNLAFDHITAKEESYREGLHFEVDQLDSLKVHLVVDIIHGSYKRRHLQRDRHETHGMISVGFGFSLDQFKSR